MRGRAGRLSGLTHARVVHALTALALTFAASATGVVVLASPSRAATAPAILASPPTTSNNPSPSWAFDNSLAPAYECAFDLASVTSPTFSACPGDGTFTAPARKTDGTDDGDYTFSVREAGADASATTTRPYTLDTVGRVSVVVAANTNDTTPKWTVAPESGPTTLSGCTLDGAAVTCPTGGTFTPSTPLGDGSHVLVVGITDALGNTGSGSATTVVDTVAPGAPTVTGSSGLHNTGSVTWSWAAAGNTASCDYTTPAGTTTVAGCTSPFTRSLPQDGAYSLAVTLTDAAGNTSTAGTSPTYTYDTVLPTAPSSITGPAVSPVVHTSQNRRPSWTFNVSTATTTCQLTGPATVPGGDCSGGSYAAPVDLVDGDWTLVVTAVSDAGNTRSASSSVYTVDNVGPLAPTVSVPDSSTPHNATAPVFTWNGELPVTAFCRTVHTDADPLVAVQRSAYVPCDARVYTAVVNGDASYQVESYLVDPAGNTGAVGISPAWQYDGTKPATPVLGGVPVKGHATTVTFHFTPEAGATALCWYTPAGGSDSAKTACDSGSYSVTFPSDGVYTVHAQQTDQATNDSLVGDVSYDLDSSLPAAPTVTAPSSPGHATTVTWTLQPNDASTLTCRLLTETTELVASASCTTQYVADLSTYGDGTYQLEITATNDHGSTLVLTSSYVLDTVKPELATITGPTSPGNSADPAWTFPTQVDTTAQCRLVQGLTALDWVDCSAGVFKPGALADGTYHIDVLVTDTAGNTTGIASSTDYVSDRTRPNAPTVTSPTSPGRDPLATWPWSGEAGATATCRLDRAGSTGVPQPCGTTSGTFAPTLTGDSTYVVVVQLTDAAGNVSDPTTTPVYELDTTPPTTPTVTGASGTSNTGSVSWTFAVETGGRAECALSDGSGAPLVFTACSSGATVTLPADGSYRLVVHTFDQAGNQSLDGTGPLYVFDGTKPATPTVAGPAVSPSQDTHPQFTFTAETAATECHVRRGAALVKEWFACTSPVTVDLSGEVDGSYVVEVRTTDAAGNVSDVGAALDYVLDRQKPDAFSVSGPAGPSSNATPSFTWPSTEADLTSTCQLFNGPAAQASVACTSPYAPTLTADGTWTLHVTTTDLAGNATTAVSGGYLFDTTPPAQPVVHSPPSPGRDVKPSWSVDVEAGSSQECLLQSGSGTTLADWASCTVPTTTDLTGQADGSYVLSVRSTDRVGLVSAVGSATYVLDSQAPDPPVLTLRTPSPGSTRSVSFSFTTEPSATVVCVLTRGGTVLSTQTGCTSPSSVSLTGLAEGPYVLSATATDQAGNTSTSASTTYVLDVTPPDSPVLSAAPVSTGSGRSPSWSFTTEAKATVTCRLVGASGFALADSDCSNGSYTPDLTGAPDDTYTFTALATDEAGNAQRTPLTGSYVLDSQAPTGPTALRLAPRGNKATVSWFVSTPGDRVVCGVTRTVGTAVTTVAPFTDCGSPYTVTLPSDGVYTFLAHTVDDAGNVSANITASYRLDTVSPASAVLTAPASPSTGRSPEWTIASPETSPTATCTVTDAAGTTVVPSAPCAISSAGTPFPLDLTGQPDGAYTLTVHLVDRAGNANVTDATSTYVLDTKAPNAVLVTAPVTPSSVKTPKWALVGDADATLECRLSSGTSAGTFAPCAADLLVPGSGSFTADLTSKPDGTYTLTVRSRDAAGNLGPEATSGYTLDTVKPVVPAPPVTGPSPSQQAVVPWTFTVEDGATAYCTLTSATKVVAPEQPCTSPWVTDLTNLPDGDYALAIRAQDKAGNTSASVSSHYVLDRIAPVAPLITSSPGTPSPVLTPTWHLKATDAKDLLECQLTGTPSPAWTSCADPVTFDLAPATGGGYRLLVRETDLAGNVSTTTTSDEYVLDPAVTAPPVVLPPDPQRSNNTKPVFVISRQPGDASTKSLQCSVTRADGKASTALPCAFGPNTVELKSASFDGPVVLSVRGVDGAGVIGGASSATYSFDNIPPATPTLLAPDPNVSFDKKAEFTFGDVEDADHYVCELRKAGQSGALPLTTCSSPDKVTFPSFGAYAFSVWAVDKAGNRSALPQAATYTYLAPVPELSVLKGPTSGNDATPTWTFSVPVGDAVECVLGLPGGQALSYVCTTPVTAARSISIPLPQALLRADLTPSAVRTSSFTANLEGRPAGTYSLTTQLTDSFGNVGEYGVKVLYRYNPAATGPDRITPNPTPPSPPGPTTPSAPGITPPVTPPSGNGTIPHGNGESSPVPRIPVAVKGSGPKSALPRIPLPSVPNLGDLPKAISGGLGGLSQKPGIPILLGVIVVGFLLLQNQIDRRDPKLASAPVGAEPEMEFGPVRGKAVPGSFLGGGAPA